MIKIDGIEVPAPQLGQIWQGARGRLRVVAITAEPHRVVFRAGGCEVEQELGTVTLDVVDDVSGESYHAYEETQWPPPGDLVRGPGAPWTRPEGCPRCLIHLLPDD